MHIGIICGCQLYEVAILTSIVVTIVLFALEHITIGKKPFVLVIHSKENNEEELNNILKKYAKNYRIKSRNFTSNGVDLAIELRVKEIDKLTNDLNKNEKVEKFSLIEYDSDDII